MSVDHEIALSPNRNNDWGHDCARPIYRITPKTYCVGEGRALPPQPSRDPPSCLPIRSRARDLAASCRRSAIAALIRAKRKRSADARPLQEPLPRGAQSSTWPAPHSGRDTSCCFCARANGRSGW